MPLVSQLSGSVVRKANQQIEANGDPGRRSSLRYVSKLEEMKAMLQIHKKIVLDENQRPFAVQVPIEEFERLEDIIEDYGLSKLMDEVKDGEKLSLGEAKEYYRSLNPDVEK